MSEPHSCSICGHVGYWIGYDSTTGEYRCANHVGTLNRWERTDRENGSAER